MREDLKPSQKLQILYNLFNHKPLDEMIDSMTNQEVVALQKFVWDKTVEFGLKTRGKDFDKTEITGRMVPTPIYQRQQGCTERIYNCKGTTCIYSNPNCARKKIKGQVQVMGDVIAEYLEEERIRKSY